jgi:hypothetical protein
MILLLSFSVTAAAVVGTEEGGPGGAQSAGNESSVAAGGNDVVATVGDTPIRFGQLSSQLDQGATPGVSVPGYGTPERRRIIERLLDNAIQSELLYQDALRRGVDQDPEFRRILARFRESALAAMLAEREPATETQSLQWREGLEIEIRDQALDPAGDATRADDVVLATVGDSLITWGDAKARLGVATRRAAMSDGALDAAMERRKVLDQLIDVPVMALRATDMGLDEDPVYLKRVEQFEKPGLTGFYYRKLAELMGPSNAEVEEYAREHADVFPVLDDRAHRTIERELTAEAIANYAEGLGRDEINVMIDAARFDELFTQEAQEHAPSDAASTSE